MKEFTIIIRAVFYISVILLIIKNMFGIHLPWEKCPYCGKRLDKNHKPLSQRRFIEEIEKQLDGEIESDVEKVERETRKILKGL